MNIQQDVDVFLVRVRVEIINVMKSTERLSFTFFKKIQESISKLSETKKIYEIYLPMIIEKSKTEKFENFLSAVNMMNMWYRIPSNDDKTFRINFR